MRYPRLFEPLDLGFAKRPNRMERLAAFYGERARRRRAIPHDGVKGVKYRKIDDAGVHISADGKEMRMAADTVIVCAGQEPRRELEGHLIGGAKEASELAAAL